MIYLIEAPDKLTDVFTDEITITGKIIGKQTQKQLDLLIKNALAFDEAVSRGLLEEDTIRKLKRKEKEN